MNQSFAIRAMVATAFALLSATSSAAQQSGAAGASLDSLLNTRISAASKYDQTAAEAPASITILTAADIQLYGYRDLQEALESVRGFYVTNDHNYPYLGTRGFSRPTDYNNRILVLIDGHAMNEQTWGAAPVGSDLPINLAAVERIEVVRGPGSVLYGTSAMFAVVNIVTKSGIQLAGATISGSRGSQTSSEAAFAAGNVLGRHGWFSVSGVVNRSGGSDFLFSELNAPETNFGVSRGMDFESAIGGIAAASYRHVTARVGYRSRSKGIPTGAYGILLDDRRAETVDETVWGEIAAKHDARGVYTISGRVYADRYRYRGVYPYGPSAPFTDAGGSTHVGGEAILLWDPVSRLRITAGSEVRHVLTAEYSTIATDGGTTSDDAPFRVASAFAQSEYQLFRKVQLVTGVRYDRHSSSRDAFTPRLAFVALPDSLTTIKVLYGNAFRAPSPAEADLSSGGYSENADLRPERVRTTEVDLQRRITQALLLGISLYNYTVRNLIEQVEIPGQGGLHYANISAAAATGLEVQADFVPAGPIAAHASFGVQNAHSEPADARLTNSPRYTGTMAVTARNGSGLQSAISVRTESGRLTLQGTETPAFVRTDVNIGYSPSMQHAPAWLRGAAVSMRVTNLFDREYFAPGGIEHVQPAIPQDGRKVTLRLDWRF